MDAKAPEFPINVSDAFFPLRRDPVDGKIYPSYQWQECMKRFVVCLSWEKKRVYIKDLEWFYLNGYGLTRQKVFGE